MSTEEDSRNIKWMQQKLKTICTGTTFCGLCLENSSNFCPLTMEFAINECYTTRPLREVINSILNLDIEDQTPSDVICEECTEKAIQAYVFIENAKKVFKILNYCTSDLLSKANDLNDELDGSHDYGDANVMIVVEYDKETYENVNEITSGNATVLSEKHIVKEQSKTSLVNCKDMREPLIVPTLRVTKHPRTKPLKADDVKFKIERPAVSLEGGKIVITPLKTNTPVVPQYNTYKCNFCQSIFTSYKSMKQHEKLIHKRKTYNCTICNKIYNSQQYLDVHYTNEHSKSRCRICKSVMNSTELNRHLRDSHEGSIHICQICDLVYYSVEKLEAHCKSSHRFIDTKLKSDLKQCVMCLKNYPEEELKRHKCAFNCLECTITPCIHYSYLMSYREQVLSNKTKIQCLDCDYKTKRKGDLITHVNREHLDHHPFTCADCGTEFYTKLGLKKHIFQFHLESKCQYCDQEFSDPKILQNHREICKSVTRSCVCEKCVASFDTDHELQKHLKLNHSEIVYPCNLCKKEYITELALKEHHLRVHKRIQFKKKRKIISCTLCDITFACTKDMFEHQTLHGPNVMYPCNSCPKKFPNLKQVYLHKQRHYCERIKCSNCSKYVAPSYWNQHKTVCSNTDWSNDLPYPCKVCEKSFISEPLLDRHQKTHMKEPCEICNKMVKVSLLKKHIEKKHLDAKDNTLKCGFCDYTTKKNTQLENHMNKVHHKIKPYSCDVCSKSFCGKVRLDEHLRTHGDKYVCTCSFCGKQFANKVCLKMHMRRHTGEKPYECNICFERFRSMSIMKTHRLKKHLDKTIQCPLCDSMYHLAIEMRFHVKKTHWKRPEPFDYKLIIPEEFHHLFQDRRLQKLGAEEDCYE